jgi:hypothetical protein
MATGPPCGAPDGDNPEIATGEAPLHDIQSSWERGDPSEGGHHVLAAGQHQTAVHDHPEQLLVGPHGDLLITRWVDKSAKLAR